MNHRSSAALVLVLCVLAWRSPALADLSMTLSSTVQNGAAGTELLFNATLTNTSGTDQLFLNDIQATLNGPSSPGLTLRSNTFFSNVPGILQPGETYDGIVFRVLLDPSATPGDYSGSVTFLGGVDIFASDPLASGDIVVLSPAVSLVATTPNAYEQGPVSGAFTITRTGGTDIPLPVSISTSGTAANGVNYSTVVSPVTIPSGSSTATVAIAPVSTGIAEGDLSAVLTLSASSSYNLGTALSDTVTVHDTPVNDWRIQYFGAAANRPQATDTASWSNDGIPNLIKYALNLNPLIAENSAIPQPVISGSYLTLSYVPNPAATDVTFSVQGSTDLINWSTANVQAVSISNPNPPGSITYMYTTPLTLPGAAFLRISVTR